MIDDCIKLSKNTLMNINHKRKDRMYQANIWGRENSPFIKRPYRLGQHGKNPKRKVSIYGERLRDCQLLRHYYNVSENQFRIAVEKGLKNKSLAPDLAFLAILESRLDQVVYKLGFAPTIFSARQLVNHGHFLVDGNKVDIPSYSLKAGQVVSIRPKSQNLAIIKTSAEKNSLSLPAYLKRIDDISGTILRTPENKNEIPFAFQVNSTSVIERYV